MRFCFILLSFFFFLGCKESNRINATTTVLVKQYTSFPKNELDTVVDILQKVYGVKTVIANNQELYKDAFCSC